jgi:MFS family permease
MATDSTVKPATSSSKTSLSAEERKVIFASSLGTVFEWYDFYLYATLTPFFAATFFPPGNETAQLIGALAAYAAGFLVRPFGALVFGRVGDLVGRKYTFLITITVMGVSTFAVGLLPSYATLGIASLVLLIVLRLLQGLALGGEYGGAAVYVAEHSHPQRRGYSTSWIQTTATLGFFLSLAVILICRQTFTPKAFSDWAWRIPFWVSLVLLIFSIYIRLKLYESPVFLKIKEEGRVSKQPLTESFLRYPNNKYVLLALFGAVAGQGVVWYTGQFYALFFLTGPLRLDYTTAYILIGIALLIGTPLFLVFGRLSDRIGRRKIILAGCLIAAVTYYPVFKQLAHSTNPELSAFADKTAISVAADHCVVHFLPLPTTEYTECDRVKNFLTTAGLSFTTEPAVPGKEVVTKIGSLPPIEGWQLAGGKPVPKTGASANDPRFLSALLETGYPDISKKVVDGKESVAFSTADTSKTNYMMVLLILVFLLVLVTMVYGPIAALLVELFPANIRYTSMSLPYHLANGWIGGLLPLFATAIAAWSGNIFLGLLYPIGWAILTVIVGGLFLHDPPKDFDIHA